MDCKIVVPGYPTLWLSGSRNTSGSVSCHGDLPADVVAPSTPAKYDVDGWRVSITPSGNVSASN